MKRVTSVILAVATLGLVTPSSASARPAVSASNYDGAWRLSFVTQVGTCDPSYDFDVNISQGIISHPNLVRFQGRVSRNGAARASVAVRDKVASGSGRLTATSGRGTWNGHSGGTRCSGYWVAQKT